MLSDISFLPLKGCKSLWTGKCQDTRGEEKESLFLFCFFILVDSKVKMKPGVWAMAVQLEMTCFTSRHVPVSHFHRKIVDLTV